MLVAGPPRYARTGFFDGVAEMQVRASEPWIAAERNAPLPESARVRTGPASRLEVELDEGSALRLAANTLAELSDYARLSTGQRITLVSVERGVAYLTGQPEGRDALALAVPGAQVTFTRQARVRIEVSEQWSQIAILRGSVRFSSPAADLELREGQTTRVEPENSARFFFFKEVLPGDLDSWVDASEEARSLSTSAAHAVQRYGLADLDGAGEWILTQDLGAVWRPKVEEDWLPYRNGKWRWYDGLGYTWISSDSWGWLPYHYGRWTRLERLGWVWVASKNGVFKPGEVYWVRTTRILGWGPLTPGEQWDPADAVNAIPQQFLNANTTWAEYRAGGRAIDPAGFTARPKDPLKNVEFADALPSPPFAASRLDAVRPLVNAASLRVKPMVEGIAIETVAERARTRVQPVVPPPSPAPVVIVTQAPPQPAPAPEIVEVPVPVPAGVVLVGAPGRAATRSGKSVSMPVTPPVASREKKYHGAAESNLVNRVLEELDARSFQKALADLDQWTARFHESDLADERAYYYMLAFHGLNQPAKVVDRAAPLVARRVTDVFDQPMQALSVVYLTAINFQKLAKPTRDQSIASRNAAKELVRILPICFTTELRPQVMSDTDWAKSREDLEALARETLARTGR
jgi:hypothetical protein